jgi:hypothetical protein
VIDPDQARGTCGGFLMRHHVAMRPFMIASEEWPIVIFGTCLGVTWTMGSLAWVFMSNELFAAHTPLDWLRAALVLPALVSVTAGEALYRSGLGFEQLGIVLGAFLAALLCIAGLLVLARRS